ncbi:MAG TPA: VOC family protein [Thermoleophilaceae bacterium]|nr:VOC family protein [Thermoleophilaceae bacterium]
MPSIDALEIADDPGAWSAAGFHVEDGECRVSRVTLRLTGKGPRRGIVDWALGDEPAVEPAGRHPNGVVSVDHVVMLTPDLDRTVAELESQGFDLRRTREGPTPGGSARQAFFRAGEPILEVVLAPEGSSVASDPSGPARLWGLAFGVDDLDRTATSLGELVGTPRDAVQPGRRIATLRAEAGLGPAIAFMSPGRDALGAAPG